MNNPILVSSKKRKFEELSCELVQGNSESLLKEAIPKRLSDQEASRNSKPNLIESLNELKISSTDKVLDEIDYEIEKRH